MFQYEDGYHASIVELQQVNTNVEVKTVTKRFTTINHKEVIAWTKQDWYILTWSSGNLQINPTPSLPNHQQEK